MASTAVRTVRPSTTEAANGHPLTPLSPGEIEAAVALIRNSGDLKASCRIQGIWLDEPEKHVILNYQSGSQTERRAVFVLLDRSTGHSEEILVSITGEKIIARKPVEIGQPAISLEEFVEAERICRADRRYQAALAKRGITDLDAVIIDLYGAGAYGDEPEGRRLARGLSWIRSEPSDNPYAHPIDNVHAIIDLNRMEIVEVEDYGVIEIPRETGNYRAGTREFRYDLIGNV